jgi:NadR type nicotinamide-nucleotide adenylyltransferase
MRKIAIVGPESSGKSTLARTLGGMLDAVVVGEYARSYLETHGTGYQERDLKAFTEGQMEAEFFAAKKPGSIMICDTDMITIRIWSEERFGRCDPWIVEQSQRWHYDLWLLCSPDIPWEPDPLRENPHDRDRLFQVYLNMLEQLGRPYEIIAGDREARIARALRAIERIG